MIYNFILQILRIELKKYISIHLKKSTENKTNWTIVIPTHITDQCNYLVALYISNKFPNFCQKFHQKFSSKRRGLKKLTLRRICKRLN